MDSNGGGGIVGVVLVIAVISLAREDSQVRHTHPKERLHVSRSRSRISLLAVTKSPVLREIAFISSVGTIGGEKVSDGNPVGL